LQYCYRIRLLTEICREINSDKIVGYSYINANFEDKFK
jgi:hypothetical protein